MIDKRIYDEVTSIVSGRIVEGQREGLKEILHLCKKLPREHTAYILATAYHETGETMEPVRETFGSNDTQVIARLDTAYRQGKLPWIKAPYWRRDADGKAWYGRGFVQLTHKENYKRAEQKTGIAFVKYPDLALEPWAAARILVRGCVEGWFTGKKLSDYLPGDYVNARRVVNGTDRAALIAGYAVEFERFLAPYYYDKPAPPPPKPTLWQRAKAWFARVLTWRI